MYCTLSDIENHINKEMLLILADDDRNGTVDNGIIEAAISAAENLINSFLENKYSIPFTVVPAMIKNIAVDFAIAELFVRHPEINQDSIRHKYIEAMRTLAQIAAGELSLGSDIDRTTDNLPQIANEDDDKLFSRETLGPF